MFREPKCRREILESESLVALFGERIKYEKNDDVKVGLIKFSRVWRGSLTSHNADAL